MKPALLIRPEAEQDLRAAYAWYERQRPGLGEDFLSCLETALLKIQLHPRQFPMIHREIRRHLVRRFPYAIFYIPRPETISVLAILHCRRDPEAWLERTREEG